MFIGLPFRIGTTKLSDYPDASAYRSAFKITNYHIKLQISFIH